MMFSRKTTTLLVGVVIILLLYFLYESVSVRSIFEKHHFPANTHQTYNIFFIESNSLSMYLTERQLCSIESAAKHNPNGNIIVKSINADLKNNRLLTDYPNIKFEIVKIEDSLNNTPLYDWWKKKLITNIPYNRIAHIANAMRLTTIYKHGGIYIDLDTITLKSFEPLLKYRCGFQFQDKKVVTNSFFVNTQIKHPLLHILMVEFTKRYGDGKRWGLVGPIMFTAVIPEYCKTSHARDLLIGNNTTNCDCVTFPYKYHQPIAFSKTPKYFDPHTPLHAIIKELTETYVIHFNTKITRNVHLSWNFSNPYEMIASLNCPVTYNMASKGLK